MFLLFSAFGAIIRNIDVCAGNERCSQEKTCILTTCESDLKVYCGLPVNRMRLVLLSVYLLKIHLYASDLYFGNII